MSTEATDIVVLKHQEAFIHSDAIHTGLVAGFGAGKSKGATIKTLSKKLMYPNINVGYYLPTYGLIRDIAFPNFSEILEETRVPFELNRSAHEFVTPYGKIIMRSMTNTESIVGYEVGYSLIDEADILPKAKMWDAFRMIAARNRKRLPDGSANSTDMVSTPEGFKFMYEFFMKSKSPNRVLIKAKTSDNPYVSESYIKTLMDTYTPEQLEAYLNGEFVNLTAGTVHHTFDRHLNHSDRTIKKGDVLHIGMDFNVTNMSAVVHVVDGRTPVAVDEITKAFDTAAMIEVITKRFPDHKIVIYPDASGAARKTNSRSSDIDLLKRARFTVRNLKKNPSVNDRITVMNTMFCNANQERTYMINTNTCPEYTEAVEKLPYKNGAPDKQSGFDHLCEAGGYFIWQQKAKKPTRIIV